MAPGFAMRESSHDGPARRRARERTLSPVVGAARRRAPEAALIGGLVLLWLSLALPFYGWDALRTVGPTVAVVGGLSLLVIPRARRTVGLGALVAGAAAVGLLVWRLDTPPSGSSPVLTVLFRTLRSDTGLALGLAGAVLVAAAGLVVAAAPRAMWSPPVATRLAAEQRSALRSAWRALWSSRALVWAAGIVGVLAVGLDSTARGTSILRPFSGAANVLIAPGTAWDSRSYLSIAQFGYGAPYFRAFFPLYPIVLRIGAWSAGATVVAGILISLAAFLVALYLLRRLVALDLGGEVADLTLLLVAFFPMALFFSAVYTESLFLALSVGAFYAARRGWWVRAGACGGLAAATRLTGLLIAIPVLVLYLESTSPRHRLRRDAVWLLLVPLGTVAYLAFMGAHGDWLAPLHAARTFWDRRLVPGLGAVDGVRDAVRSVHQLFAGSGSHALRAPPSGVLSDPGVLAGANLTDFAFLAFGVVSAIGTVRRLPAAYGAYAIASVAVIASTTVPYEPLASFPRYLAVVFPCQVWLATRLRGPTARRIALFVSAVLLALFSAQFARGAWVA
jgi:hypothetical protein